MFQYENMRNAKLKTVRDEWSHSKFFIGKNRVLAKALGNTEAEEYSDNLHLISKCLKNECGLLATNQSQDDVMEYFSNLSEPDFARTGGVATETVELKEGVLEQFSHSMEPQLRQLGSYVTFYRLQSFNSCEIAVHVYIYHCCDFPYRNLYFIWHLTFYF